MGWNAHVVEAADSNNRVCFMTSGPEGKVNAAFIVLAVNNHYKLVEALAALVDNVNDYERINNLSPNPGRTECWDTVAHAKRILALVAGSKQP
jgi:hypothetical protein